MLELDIRLLETRGDDGLSDSMIHHMSRRTSCALFFVWADIIHISVSYIIKELK